MFEPDKLRSAIEQIWKFIIPPLISTGILLCILFFVTNGSFLNADSALFPDFFFIEQPHIQRVLAAYKLTDLVPAIAILIIFFFLNLIDRILHTIGLILPVNYTYNRTFLFLNTYNFLELSKFYPASMESNDLATIIEQNGHEEKLKQTVNGGIIKSLEIERSRIFSRLEFLKSLLVLSIVLLPVNRIVHREIFSTPRLVILTGIILLLMFLVLMQQAAAHLRLANHLTSTLYGRKLTETVVRQSDHENRIFVTRFSAFKKEDIGQWWFIRFKYNALSWRSILKAFRIREYTKALINAYKKLKNKRIKEP